MRAWVMQSSQPLPIDLPRPRPLRAMNLTDALVRAGHDVVIWSGAFDHRTRTHRARDFTRIRVSDQVEVRMIPTIGYSANIGPGRLADHAQLGGRLARALRTVDPPDVAFVGYPPIEFAAAAVQYLSARGVPSIVDVKDQWPDYLVDAVPAGLRVPARVALTPYYALARRTLRAATAITAMSDPFLNWTLAFAGRTRTPLDRAVPLTSPTPVLTRQERAAAEAFWDARGVYADGQFRAVFVGSFSRTGLDFEPVASAVKSLDMHFVLAGAGPALPELQLALTDFANVDFPGWLDSSLIETLSERSSLALVPYERSAGFERSIPNKVFDALRLGLPILTPLGGEVGRIIEEHHVGARYGESPMPSLSDQLLALKSNSVALSSASSSASSLYRREFDARAVYDSLTILMEEIAR